MLNSLTIGLALYLLSYIALEALAINWVVVSDDVQSNLSYNIVMLHYLTRQTIGTGNWALILFTVGCTIVKVLMYEQCRIYARALGATAPGPPAIGVPQFCTKTFL